MSAKARSPGQTWWPGSGTEPLSYAAAYSEAQSECESASNFNPIPIVLYVMAALADS